jgi:serine/threonine-protein kinase RIO1
MEQRRGGRGRHIKELTFDEVKRDAIDFGLATDVLYQMNAGKEASIFLAVWKNHPIVLKAYRLWHSSQRVSQSHGFVGVATSKRTYCIHGIVEHFAVLEFDLMMNCFRAGMQVPKPIIRVGNYLTMRFIGDDGIPAFQLKDIILENPNEVLDKILDDYLVMYRDVHYVQGDLSPNNILWWENKPLIIDLPQAYKVDKHCNMRLFESMLLANIKNLLKYFENYDIYRAPNSILEIFLSEYIPENMKHYRELSFPSLEFE